MSDTHVGGVSQGPRTQTRKRNWREDSVSPVVPIQVHVTPCPVYYDEMCSNFYIVCLPFLSNSTNV